MSPSFRSLYLIAVIAAVSMVAMADANSDSVSATDNGDVLTTAMDSSSSSDARRHEFFTMKNSDVRAMERRDAAAHERRVLGRKIRYNRRYLNSLKFVGRVQRARARGIKAKLNRMRGYRRSRQSRFGPPHGFIRALRRRQKRYGSSFRSRFGGRGGYPPGIPRSVMRARIARSRQLARHTLAMRRTMARLPRVIYSKIVRERNLRRGGARTLVDCPNAQGSMGGYRFGRRHAMLYEAGGSFYRTCLAELNTPGFLQVGEGVDASDSDSDSDSDSGSDSDSDSDARSSAITRAVRRENNALKALWRQEKRVLGARGEVSDAAMEAGTFDKTMRGRLPGQIPRILFNSDTADCAHKQIKRLRSLYPGDVEYKKCLNMIFSMRAMPPSADLLLSLADVDTSAAIDEISGDILAEAGVKDDEDAQEGSRRTSALLTEAINRAKKMRSQILARAKRTRNKAQRDAIRRRVAHISRLLKKWVHDRKHRVRVARGVRFRRGSGQCKTPVASRVGFTRGRSDAILLKRCLVSAGKKNLRYAKAIAKETEEIRAAAENPLLNKIPMANRAVQEQSLRAITEVKAQAAVQRLIAKFQDSYLKGYAGRSQVDLERVHSANPEKEALDDTRKYKKWNRRGESMLATTSSVTSDSSDSSTSSSSAASADPSAIDADDNQATMMVVGQPSSGHASNGMGDDVGAPIGAAEISDPSMSEHT